MAVLLAATSRGPQAGRAEVPETVILTARPKAGQESALASLLARHWTTARALHLVREDRPDLRLRAVDADGKPYFVEIFTWRDANIPDHAPPPILAIWQALNDAVEPRRGQPGLDITAATVVVAPTTSGR